MAQSKPKKKDDRAIIEALTGQEPRFHREAYYFVQQALGFTLRRIIEENRREVQNPPHVTGQELLAGVRDLARERFGRLAPLVFRRWGVRASADFGRIVYQMIEAGLMTRNPTDSLDDFQHGFDLDEAFGEFDVRLDEGDGDGGARAAGEAADEA